MLLVGLAALALAAPASPAANPIQQENALAGSAGWSPFGASVVQGYASEVSVAPGDTLHLHVSAAPRADYRIEVFRLGWYGGLGGRIVACLPGCLSYRSGPTYAIPAPDPATGAVRAGWPVTDAVQIGQDWVSGYYVARLVPSDGSGTATVPFIVRPSDVRRSPILVVVPVNTWQAYNSWGGKSLYDFNSAGGVRANHISFDRPYSWTDAGNQPLSSWEIPLLRFLEREGDDVSYVTDLDVDGDPNLLVEHRLVIVAGHDEYWTKAMRDAYERARDRGTDLAFMGANAAYWQVRYEDGSRTIAGYKSTADPEPSPALKTILFRNLTPPRPECSLIGVQHYEGTYQWPRADFTVGDARQPWFAGTGLGAGVAVTQVLSREHDQIPASGSCVPHLTTLFHHEGTDPLERSESVTYTAPSGARVFASGSLEFSWALDDYRSNGDGFTTPVDSRVQQFVRNMLADMTRPEPPLSVVPIQIKAKTVRVRVRWPDDPRIEGALVYRERGTTLVPVCRRPVRNCVETLKAGTYRYQAVLVDGWGVSTPVRSAAIRVVKA
jgi:hypothetical protein